MRRDSPDGVPPLSPPPQISIIADTITIRGSAVALTSALLKVAVDAIETRYGRRRTEHEARILSYFATASERALEMSGVGHADVRRLPNQQVSGMGSPVVGSKEAADVLGCTTRHICRLASTLDGRKVRGAWTFDREAVLAYALDAGGTATHRLEGIST